MKNYSMKIKDWTFELEVFVNNGEIEATEYFSFRGLPAKRNDVPKELIVLFDGFSEDVLDLDWDTDYGYQGGVG